MTLRCIGMKHDNQTRQTVNAGITKRDMKEKRRTSFYRLNGERRNPSRKKKKKKRGAITHKPPRIIMVQEGQKSR